MSNGGSVTEDVHMVDMVARAKERWGGVHILINNAGVLRDKSFAKMEPADFGFVVDVHLIGSANCTKAVWETMREQQYGRVLMTASSRSEEHTSELQSLMRISYAVFCLKKKK